MTGVTLPMLVSALILGGCAAAPSTPASECSDARLCPEGEFCRSRAVPRPVLRAAGRGPAASAARIGRGDRRRQCVGAVKRVPRNRQRRARRRLRPVGADRGPGLRADRRQPHGGRLGDSRVARAGVRQRTGDRLRGRGDVGAREAMPHPHPPSSTRMTTPARRSRSARSSRGRCCGARCRPQRGAGAGAPYTLEQSRYELRRLAAWGSSDGDLPSTPSGESALSVRSTRPRRSTRR
jgi:hypothetical protein